MAVFLIKHPKTLKIICLSFLFITAVVMKKLDKNNIPYFADIY